MKFIKSGVPGLDEILGGGLPEGSITTVSGPTGAGKSTLASQFIYNGALESDEPGLYIAIEESRKDFFFHNSGYKWDFAALERDRKFILLDYPIHEVDQIVNQSAAISEIISGTGTKRVVIDSIMPVALFFHTEDERKKGFLKFIENLRRWNVTTIIVSEDVKMSSPENMPNTEFGIETFTDGWINLFYRYDQKTMDRTRYVDVMKMKGVEHSAKPCPVRIDENGIHLLQGPEPAKAAPKPPPTEPQGQKFTFVIGGEPPPAAKASEPKPAPAAKPAPKPAARISPKSTPAAKTTKAVEKRTQPKPPAKEEKPAGRTLARSALEAKIAAARNKILKKSR